MMTPEEMAALHARAFAGQGRAWRVEEFIDLSENPLVFAVCDRGAFALGRVIAGEAELLTIATDPAQRRQGLGRMVLATFEVEAAQRGARELFLEVAADNTAAIGLYQNAGYDQIATRTGYYRKPDGVQVDALIFRKETG